MKQCFIIVCGLGAIFYWAILFFFALVWILILYTAKGPGSEWKSATLEEIGLEENADKFLTMVPFAEDGLPGCEFFLIKGWVRPSTSYVYGRMRLDSNKKDFYREIARKNSFLMDPDRVRTELFPFISEIWDNPPDKVCVLKHSTDVVVLTNAPEFFFEKDFSSDSNLLPVSSFYVYFYVSQRELFR